MALQELFGSIGSSSHLEVQLDAWRVCIRCNAEFQERDNIGSWKCVHYHPLSHFASPRDATYRCCGRDIGSYGCVRADHTDQRMVDLRPKRVNRAIVPLLDKQLTKQQSWHADQNGGFIVHRHDPDAHTERCSISRIQPDNTIKMCSTKRRPVF